MSENNVPTEFKLPDDAQAYISLIESRVRNLIDSQIWEGIKIERVEQWLSNYQNDKEKYFATRILDFLIYRSEPQTKALIENLFSRCLPEALRKINGNNIDWLMSLKGSVDPGIRIVPVIRDDDPPTKSGPLVARIIKRFLRLNEKWMIWPFKIDEHINDGKTVFLFIDDFLGTGTQFIKFANRNNLKSVFQSNTCIYAPLAASVSGIELVQEEFPDLLVTTSEELKACLDIFSDDSECFNDGVNTPESAKLFYEELLERISGIPKNRNRFAYGYGHLAMIYAFDHASPNASIPLLWYEYDGFTPLFDR